MLKTYHIDCFRGIDQSKDENAASPETSPDACNMDTADGNLRVAAGYVKHIQSPVPGTERIYRLARFRSAASEQLLALCAGCIYACNNGEWTSVHTFSPVLTSPRFDFASARIGGTDYLIIATGEGQLLKYDGSTVTAFGSTAGLSDISVSYLAMYKSRLFSAGDSANPNRLYWSQLPGGDRTIESWGPVASSPNVEGGHTEIGDTGGDPIIALAALSNQLLIFKKNSLYRLIGEKPGNFIVERIDARIPAMAHTALTFCGDVVYCLTPDGMYVFNGVTIQPTPDARCVRDLVSDMQAAQCRGAVAKDKLYFAFEHGGESIMVEYDILRRTYMRRGGFAIWDILEQDGRLLVINSARYVYRLGEGTTYDGQPINAYWRTPLTDLYDKMGVKALKELYLRSDSGAPMLMDIHIGQNVDTYTLRLPQSADEVLEAPLKNEGRTFSIKLYNEAGAFFSIQGGIELLHENRRRTR